MFRDQYRTTTLTVPLVLSAALTTFACEGPHDVLPPGAKPHDPDDAMTVRLHRFYLDRPGVLSDLAQEELGYFGPFDGRDGRYVVVHTTGRHADIYARSGIRVALHERGPTAGDSDDVGATLAALGECTMPNNTSPPDETDLIRRYDNLVGELDALTGSGISMESIGQTVEGRDIVALRVGPIESVFDAPTLVLVSGQHARERVTVAVALGIARWLRDVIDNPSLDPAMYDALLRSSIVIVPSANPDGYEYTWTDRMWRGNRNTSECPSGGVDLNRNLPTSWQADTDYSATSAFCNSLGSFWGSTLQPENEAIDDLLGGRSPFENINPRALINYHSHATLLLYPSGYKEATDSLGPRCGLDGSVFRSSVEATFCTNPDFTLLRRLFGDTELGMGLWTDYSLGASNPAHYYRDHVASVLYPVSGDLGTHAQYGYGMLTVSPELPGFCRSFAIELLPDPDTAILDIVEDQKPVLARVLSALPGLASTSVATAYAPNELGTVGHTLFTREYTEDAFDMSSTHGMFVTPIWRPADSGSLTVNINGTSYAMDRLRPGAQYNVYGLSSDSGAFDPHCPPCLLTFDDHETGAGALNCAGDCVDLCDPGRLPVSGFEHRPSEDWGTSSCEYVADAWGATIVIPGGTPPPNSTSCYLTFSVYGDQYTFSVERDGIEIYRSHPGAPYNGSVTPGGARQLVTYAFEANGMLPSGVPDFVIRTLSFNGGSEPLRIYDPVIYCRFGPLP